ncbi:MAG: hypothetical protein WCL23_05315 [Candidatus Moraniibacteriota bacterium]
MDKKLISDRMFERIIRATAVVAVLIFSLSYAFGQYIRYRESNVRDLEAWIDCARTEQFSDRAYEFCREKAEENYLFKKSYHWGMVESAPVPVIDEE